MEPMQTIDDVEIQEKVESLAGKGTRVIDCEKSSSFKTEEVLLVNGFPVPLNGEEGARIKKALMTGQVPPCELLNEILIRAGILKSPVELETTMNVKSTTKTTELLTLRDKNGVLVDERMKEVEEDNEFKSTSREIWKREQNEKLECLDRMGNKQLERLSLSCASNSTTNSDNHHNSSSSTSTSPSPRFNSPYNTHSSHNSHSHSPQSSFSSGISEASGSNSSASSSRVSVSLNNNFPCNSSPSSTSNNNSNSTSCTISSSKPYLPRSFVESLLSENTQSPLSYSKQEKNMNQDQDKAKTTNIQDKQTQSLLTAVAPLTANYNPTSHKLDFDLSLMHVDVDGVSVRFVYETFL